MNLAQDNTGLPITGVYSSSVVNKTEDNERVTVSITYSISRRAFDVLFSAACIPLFLTICLTFLCLNPFFNSGSLFFVQDRIGRGGKPFKMIKFRSMTKETSPSRGHDEPLEKARITRLGQWMRSTRFDEIPQILNVLKGEMSVIGPRPEMMRFDKEYRKVIPGYELRYAVRPGITGYAQVVQGYTDSMEAVHQKCKLDHYYLFNRGWLLDLKILFRTVAVVWTAHGAR